MMKILVINGPNLNFLGVREPEIYGKKTYKDLVRIIKLHAKKDKVKVKFFQSNHEGKIVDRIQKAYYQKFDGIIINPAAYTHTSVAILDALKSVKNAITLEEVAFMAYNTIVLNKDAQLQKELLDKHYLRKHGTNAYYGQESKK